MSCFVVCTLLNGQTTTIPILLLDREDLKTLFMVFRFFAKNSSYLKYFWKLGLWCLKNNRKFMDKAFLYGIMIYQMHQTYLHIKKSLLLQNNKGFEPLSRAKVS